MPLTQLKSSFILSLGNGVLTANDALLQKLRQMLIQSLHTMGIAGLNGRIHLGDFILADKISDRRDADHDLPGSDSSAASALEQGLGNYGP